MADLATITDDALTTNYLPLSLTVAIATMSRLVFMKISHSYPVTMHTHIRSSPRSMSSPCVDLLNLSSSRTVSAVHRSDIQMMLEPCHDYAIYDQLLGKQGSLSQLHHLPLELRTCRLVELALPCSVFVGGGRCTMIGRFENSSIVRPRFCVGNSGLFSGSSLSKVLYA